MMKTKNNLSGQRFGKLVVIEQDEDYVSPKGMHLAKWRCMCDCGTITSVIDRALMSGHTTSCGCYKKESARVNNKKYNKYDLTGTYGIGWTTNTNKEFYFELDRYNDIKDICWYETVHNGFHKLSGYDCNTKKTVYMHIYLGYKNYDHIDRNELNNLKSNLRPCTQQQNLMNRSVAKNNVSGVTGVGFHKETQKWIARIKINKNSKYLGLFSDINDAIKARLLAEKHYFKEFSPQKHLFEKYNI